jgi:hypothetical protein
MSTVWGFLAGWCITTVGSTFSLVRAWEEIMVQPDGRVLIATRSYSNYERVTYRDLEGREVELQDEDTFLLEARLEASVAADDRFRPLSWHQRIVAANDGRMGSYWYLIHNNKSREGRAHLVGFDPVSGRRVGYLGRNGFQSTHVTEDQSFAVDGRRFNTRGGAVANMETSWGGIPYYDMAPLGPRGHMFLVDGAQLLDVDLRNRIIKKLLVDQQVLSLGIGSHVVQAQPSREEADTSGDEETDGRRTARRLFVRMPDRVTVLDPRTESSQAFLLPDELKDRTISSFFSLGKEEALVICQRRTDGQQWNDLYRVAASGGLLSTDAVLLPSQQVEPAGQSVGWILAAIVPSALANVIALTIALPRSMIDSGQAASFGEALRESLSSTWPSLLTVLLLGALVGWITARLQETYHRGSTPIWVASSFLLGPMGLLAYWLHFRRPLLEKCSNCGRLAPRDRDACAMCDAEFPTPKPLGNELFA